MNGDAVACLMKASKSDVPIAILSADEGIEQTALRAVDAYICKSESLATFWRLSSSCSIYECCLRLLVLVTKDCKGVLPDRV
jgi:hypothetical protein